MFKFYFVSQSDFDSQIKPGKFTPQAKQLYAALAKIGKPTRGKDIVAVAVSEFGLQTRQDYDVLAAWYFSVKRRPTCVRLVDASLPVDGPSEPVYAE